MTGLSTILARTTEYGCIFQNLQIYVEPLFMIIFISTAYQMFSVCSSNHVIHHLTRCSIVYRQTIFSMVSGTEMKQN